MRARTLIGTLCSNALFISVVFVFTILPVSAADAMWIVNIAPPSFTPDIHLSLAIGDTSVVNGSALHLSSATALPVSISLSAIPGGTADWSSSGLDTFDGTENSETYWYSFYLDFYKGTLLSDATFVGGEQMNAAGPTLKATSTVALLGPGTYSAVLYGTQFYRDYWNMCPDVHSCAIPHITLDQIRAGLEQGASDTSFPPYQFVGVVTFTVLPDDPCAVPGSCASNVLFLPGIEGSRLYEGTGCGKSAEEKLWEPVDSEEDVVRGVGDGKIGDLALDATGESTCSDIYTKEGDVIDTTMGGNLYKSFIDEMNGLKGDGTIADWEPVSYDWRLSLDDVLTKGAEHDGKIYYNEATSTPYIEQTLRALAASSKTGKVTIVAHSNGGLVAKALLTKLGDAETAKLVDKVILVAVPQTGAPADVASLLVGNGSGLYSDIGYLKGAITIVSNQAARTFAQNSPMAYHLLPSQSYFDSVMDDPNHPVACFAGDGYAKEEAAYGNAIGTESELDDFLVAKEGGREKPAASDLTSAEVLSPSLIDYANKEHNALDAWTPPASVEVDQVAGWGVDTVSGINFYSTVPPSFAGPLAAIDSSGLDVARAYKPITIEDGDGTVPVPSALAIASSTNVKRYWMDLHKYNNEANLKRSHSDLFEIPSLEDLVRTPKFAHNPCMINRTNIQAYEKASHCPRREGADYQPH